jgi:hypothetical protein
MLRRSSGESVRRSWQGALQFTGRLSNSLRDDAGRKHARSARPTNPAVPLSEAPNREYRSDWEGGVSGQENVLLLFQSSETLGLHSQTGSTGDAVVLVRPCAASPTVGPSPKIRPCLLAGLDPRADGDL